MTALAYRALWIFVFSVPWERIISLPGIAIIPKVTGGLAAGLALLAVVISGRFRRWHFFHVAALLFWVWAALGLLLFHANEKLPAKFWTYGQLLLVVWMTWELVTTQKRVIGLMTAYVLGASVAAIDTILLSRRMAGLMRRFSAGGGDANELAMMLALALPMAWYLGSTYRRPLMRWVCRAYIPLGVLGVGLSGSRGGMIAATVALTVVPLTMTRLTPGRMASTLAMLGLAGILAVVYVPETIIQRLATTGTELQSGDVSGRGKLWKAGLQVLPQHPIFGFGTSSFKGAISPRLGDKAQVAHNSYISVLVEQGLVGLTLFLCMIGAVFRSNRPLPKLERRYALAELMTLCVTILPLTWEDSRPVWVVLSLLLGFSQLYRGLPGATPGSRPDAATGRPVATRTGWAGRAAAAS